MQDGEEVGAISGPYQLDADVLVLDGGEQGSMVGRVTSGGADQFNFRLIETTEDDSGLNFKRQ